MNEKHNLDRLFQEKFKDFEVAPPEFVWENIQGELQGKKKSKVIPLWLRLSGVAALLVLGGLLATLFFNDAENPATNAPAVVIDNTTATPADALKASPASAPVQSGPSAAGTTSTEKNTTNTNTAVASGEDNTNTAGNNSATRQPNTTNRKVTNTLPALNSSNNAVASGKDNTNAAGNNSATKQSNSTNRKATNTLPALNSSNNAVAHEGHNTTINKNNGKRTKRNNLQPGNAAVASQTTNQNNRNNNPSNAANTAQTQKTGITTTAVITEGLAASDTKSSIKNTDNGKTADQNNTQQKQNALNNAAASEGVAGTDNGSGKTSENAEKDPAMKNNTIIDKNIPVTEAVAETAVDTTKTIVPENELEKLLQDKLNGKEEEDAVAKKESKERWNIRPQVAPVFYSSLSSGSPINEQFASNSKTYDNDMSYGLGVNYAVTDRISIRSGINTVNLNYSTNDIAYYTSINNNTPNIGQSKAVNYVVQNPGDSTPEPFLINGQSTQLVEGSMEQKTGYIEVPLEMSYALVNRKFGIDLIGGVSSLFLNENSVSVISSTGMSTKIGQAQNLNNLHFSTNVGVGFKYKFWDSFQASFEPTFKYQVNAYSKDAGNFKPYFIGLYSGVSFSF